VRILELKARIMGLTPAEAERLKSHASILGLAVAVQPKQLDSRSLELFGKKLSGIPDEAVRVLLTAFFQSQEFALSKEEICRAVWKLRYDPIAHDGRIYKLIHRARANFPGKKLFTNTYGGYRMNLSSPKRLSGQVS
jgi:hypothetical protein